jgi:hypothetical protein
VDRSRLRPEHPHGLLITGARDPDATAYGYAVFPNVGKGGLGLGAAHGNGLVYQDGNVVGKTELKEVT